MATDLSTYEGADDSWLVTLSDSSGDPIDITGYTFLFTVKDNLCDSDEDVIIKKVITSHIDPTAGQTKIIIDSEDTANKSGTYMYDFQQLTATNLRGPVLKKAEFKIEQRVGDAFS
jgi:hypothetical protein